MWTLNHSCSFDETTYNSYVFKFGPFYLIINVIRCMNKVRATEISHNHVIMLLMGHSVRYLAIPIPVTSAQKIGVFNRDNRLSSQMVVSDLWLAWLSKRRKRFNITGAIKNCTWPCTTPYKFFTHPFHTFFYPPLLRSESPPWRLSRTCCPPWYWVQMLFKTLWWVIVYIHGVVRILHFIFQRLVVIGGTVETARRASMSAWNGFIDCKKLDAASNSSIYMF